MGQRNGGRAIAGKRNNIQENDIYFTPVVARQMLDYLSPHFSDMDIPDIYDECANDGVLGYALCDWFKENKNQNVPVTYHDIKDDGKSAETYSPGKHYSVIIANPPFVPVTLPEAIYHNLCKHLKPNGVLIFIINNVFVYRWKRAEKLNFQKYYFLPRYVFCSTGKSLLDCGVMIYHINNTLPEKAINLNCYIPISKETCKYGYKKDKKTIF